MSTELVEAAGALAVARGPANGMLAAPALAYPDTRMKIATSRALAIDELAKGLASVPEDADP